MPVSELFPHVAELRRRPLHHPLAARHQPGPRRRAARSCTPAATTSSGPSMGSWVTYGLGTENQNLPGFVTICPTLAHGGVNNWGSAFLPAAYQGTPLGNASIPVGPGHASATSRNAALPRDVQRLQLDLLAEMNREHLAQTGPDPALEGRIDSFELAFRMQTADARGRGPLRRDAGDAASSTASTTRSPPTSAGSACWPAGSPSAACGSSRSRTATRACSGTSTATCKKGHEKNAREVDQPIAGLLTDLKARGLLEDTLVLWGGEFGRTPDGPGQRRPRPQPRRLHHVAGRRRRARRASATARPTTTATTPSRTRSTSTTCTPPSCTCSASTTSG